MNPFPPARLLPLTFTEADAEKAHQEWGCNCGPAAISAVTGETLERVRSKMKGFDERRYTNPTMMYETLRSLGHHFFVLKKHSGWPNYGLVRIQWGGPWLKEGVHPAAAYRHTHWIGALYSHTKGTYAVFDVNCMNSGGWVGADDWAKTIVPWLAGQTVKRWDGTWFPTHVLEVTQRSEDFCDG